METIRVNITFTPQELFFEKDNNLYFLIRVDRLFTYDEEEDISILEGLDYDKLYHEYYLLIDFLSLDYLLKQIHIMIIIENLIFLKINY